MKTRISIVIPCYNVEKYIVRCMDSIERQTYGFDNIEVILVDDISSDSTYEIITEYASKYENVTVIKNEKKRFIGGSRNAGLKAVTGEYVMFVDSDDYIDSTMVEKMYNCAKNSNCDLVQCEMLNTEKEDEKGQRKGDDRFLDLSEVITRKNYILNHYSVDAVAKLFKTEFMNKYNIGFTENVKYETLDFMGVLLFTLQSVYHLNESLYFYFKNPNSVLNGSYSSASEIDSMKTQENLEKKLKDLNLWEDVKNIYWKEYQYFIFCKYYLDYMYRTNIWFKKLEDHYIKSIADKYPDIVNNEYINSLRAPENVTRVNKVRNYLFTKNEDYLEDKGLIHICMGLHDQTGEYSKYVAAVMISTMRNTSDRVCFHIICDDSVSEFTRNRLRESIKQYRAYIAFHDVKKEEFIFGVDQVSLETYSIGCMFRLAAPVVLAGLDKVIYLDADVLVNKDIKELWNIDLGSNCIAGVVDEGLSHGIMAPAPVRTGYVSKESYINSGVLAMNLAEIRGYCDLMRDSVEYMDEFKDYNLPDQDILNYLFANKILLLDKCWNTFTKYERNRTKVMKECIYHFMGERHIIFTNPTEFDKAYLRTIQLTSWGYVSVEKELFSGLARGTDRGYYLQDVVKVLTSSHKKKIYYGRMHLGMIKMCEVAIPEDGDYFIEKDPYYDVDGKRLGIPVREFEAIQSEEKGTFVVFVLPEADDWAAIHKLETIGLTNGVDFFVIPRLLCSEQGGYIV